MITIYREHPLLTGMGISIEVFHAPEAHTDGDAIVCFHEANVIHNGGIPIFNGMYPFIDVDTGGSIDGMIAVARRRACPL